MNYDMNWGGPGYATYEVEMKVSGQEKTAANMTSQESSFLMNMLQTQFSEQQNLLTKVLIPQLQNMATNPQGFGAQAMADIRAQTVGTIGTQLTSQRQALQQQFATANMAGLGSGVEAAISASMGAGAAGEEASALQQQQIANAQLKAQQQQWALGTLGQIEPQLGAAPQAAGILSSNLNNQFQNAYTMSQQGGFWSNLARGALGAVAGGLEGGPWGAVLGGAQGFLGGQQGGGGGILGNLGSLFHKDPLQVETNLAPQAGGWGVQPMPTDILGSYTPAMPTLASS
jgi:hypothetical protein